MVLAARGAKPAASPSPRPVVGVVSEVSGSAALRNGKGKASKPARIGYALRAGDTLELGAGATATIVLPSRCEVVSATAAAGTLTATAEDLKSSAGDLARSPLDPCLSATRITAAADSTLRAGATVLRGDAGLLVLEPADLTVCTTRPRIRWKSAIDAARASVTILDATGASIGTGTAGGGAHSLDFPGATPLAAGEAYRVRVDLLDAAGATLRSAEGPFSVASQPQMDSVTRSGGFLAALYADDAGCWADALRLYRESAGENPPENVAARVKWLAGVLGVE